MYTVPLINVTFIWVATWLSLFTFTFQSLKRLLVHTMHLTFGSSTTHDGVLSAWRWGLIYDARWKGLSGWVSASVYKQYTLHALQVFFPLQVIHIWVVDIVLDMTLGLAKGKFQSRSIQTLYRVRDRGGEGKGLCSGRSPAVDDPVLLALLHQFIVCSWMTKFHDMSIMSMLLLLGKVLVFALFVDFTCLTFHNLFRWIVYFTGSQTKIVYKSSMSNFHQVSGVLSTSKHNFLASVIRTILEIHHPGVHIIIAPPLI
jgi:hypothetical protein